MQQDINQWIGEGNIGTDLILRHTHKTNKPVTNFFIYVQDIHLTRDVVKKTTSKIPIVAWDTKATFITSNLSKGDKVRVVGKVKTRLIEKENFAYHAFEVTLESISLVSSPKEFNSSRFS